MTRYADVQLVRLPRECSPQQFAEYVMAGAPRWLTLLLDIRDAVTGRLGFAVQHKSDQIAIKVGESLGPFIIRDVTPEAVRAGNSDRHINYETTFATAVGTDGTHIGVMTAVATSVSLLGKIYLRLIWPGHRALMPIVLRSAVRRAYGGR